MSQAKAEKGGPPAAADAPADEGEELLELVLLPPPRERIEGIVIGRVIEALDGVRVAFPGTPEGVAARALAGPSSLVPGAEVALLFEEGDPSRPVILGRMAEGLGAARSAAAASPPGATAATPGDAAAPDDAAATGAAASLQVTRDGERLVLTAEREIVLQCGEASITLTRAGKILLRGAYVSSRATGVNRIQGGSVEIN
ncbi:DUF6484 domain-containing protein [Sorangium sp. So ce426]|uniref:DUF6484 domain-containing protein n=1 Tax=unclassified Sorangium TaxID=2621164 RepID=UPI003F5B538A